MTLQLSIVDQSPVHGDRQPNQAPINSIELAKHCDTLGYSRYWLAEHHNSIQFAGPCPEILIARIAAETRNMRIGSGGVMLSHYSPYKVAEIFRMLETLYPDRIDLGIGRAPGGNQLATAALALPHASQQSMSVDHFPEQASDLVDMLRNEMDASHPLSALRELPDNSPKPELWMLGSGGGSSTLAGQLGMGLAVARFIAPDHCNPSIFDNYEQHFHQAGHEQTPSKMLAIAAVCAETEKEAKFLAGTAAHRKVMTSFGKKAPLLSPDEVQDAYAQMSEQEKAMFDHTIDRMTCGTVDQCWSDMQRLSEEFGTTEISLVTVTHSFEARKESYRLLASELS